MKEENNLKGDRKGRPYIYCSLFTVYCRLLTIFKVKILTLSDKLIIICLI